MKKLNRYLPLFLIAMLIFGCQDDYELEDQTDDEFEEYDAYSQLSRSCGLTEHMELLMQDPEFVRRHEDKLRRLADYEKTTPVTKALCNSPVILPVAVHFQNVNNPNASCLIALAQTQIDILNNDYQGKNSDISKWNNNASSYFPGVDNGETCIEFCLATKNHPSGFGLSEGSPAVTINKTNGDFNSSWSGYINIFVQPNTGYLGYAPLGGEGNGDGVVIDASAFGSGNGCGNISPDPPYDLGRTLTHEMGHYLLLDHIWGNGCNVDDGVGDTPDQNSEYYGCPNLGQSSCGSNDMFMNYLDYTDDACMYMFSNGQSNRMENYMNSNLNNLINNASNVCGAGSSDGGGSGGGGDGGSGGGDGGSGGDGGGGSNACVNPAVNVNILRNTKARLSWNKVPKAKKYRIRYRRVNTGNWIIKTTKGTKVTLKKLKKNKKYEYQIRVQCPGGWISWSSKDFFTVKAGGGGGGGTSCNKNAVKLKITLDYFGSDITWELVNDNGNILGSGGPYQDNSEGQVITKDFCLNDGCYTLYVDDIYGDGLCCEYGNGSIKILNANGQTIGYSDGKFGYYDIIDFCTQGGSARMAGERKDDKKNLAPRLMRDGGN